MKLEDQADGRDRPPVGHAHARQAARRGKLVASVRRAGQHGRQRRPPRARQPRRAVVRRSRPGQDGQPARRGRRSRLRQRPAVRAGREQRDGLRRLQRPLPLGEGEPHGAADRRVPQPEPRQPGRHRRPAVHADGRQVLRVRRRHGRDRRHALAAAEQARRGIRVGLHRHAGRPAVRHRHAAEARRRAAPPPRQGHDRPHRRHLRHRPADAASTSGRIKGRASRITRSPSAAGASSSSTARSPASSGPSCCEQDKTDAGEAHRRGSPRGRGAA